MKQQNDITVLRAVIVDCFSRLESLAAVGGQKAIQKYQKPVAGHLTATYNWISGCVALIIMNIGHGHHASTRLCSWLWWRHRWYSAVRSLGSKLEDTKTRPARVFPTARAEEMSMDLGLDFFGRYLGFFAGFGLDLDLRSWQIPDLD